MTQNMLNQSPLSQEMPIFVVGTPRSGTTMVGRILGQHSAIFSTRESYFFEDVWSRKKDLGELDTAVSVQKATERFMTLFGRLDLDETQALVDQHISETSLTQAVLENGGGYGVLYFEMMSRLAQSQNKTLFCDDTPKHLYYLETILEYFPHAKFIGVSRDPRDFLCSYKNYWQHSEDSERMKALYHPISTSLLWRGAAKLMEKHAQNYPDNFKRINYEAIVQNPEVEIRAICDFLGLKFSPKLLDVRQSNSSFDKGTRASGIFQSSIGRWQNCLTQEELWISQKLNKGLMASQNYQINSSSPSPAGLFKILINFPFQVIKALRINREYRGPLLVYLAKRLFSLS